MIITETALKLTKRYAAGASCEIDFDNIENTMFWPHYEKLAREAGFNEIRREIVEKYWLKVHNRIVLELFLKKEECTLKEADNCLVRPGRIKKLSEKKLIISYTPLCFKKGKLSLSMGDTIKEINKESLEVQEDIMICFHGKAAVDIISEEQADMLIRDIKNIIESLIKSSK